MRLNVSSWSIRNPTPVLLLYGILTVGGLMAFRAMKVQNFPDIDAPIITVMAILPGASPAQLETDVARKIESSLATVQGVKHIQSTLTDGAASISIEFRLEKPIQEALDDVRDAVARIRSDLPADMRDPVIEKVQLVGSPILTYTVASERMDVEALSWFVDNELSRSLLAVPGVGAITRVGGVSREVRVSLDPARMFALNTTAGDISRQLRQIQQDGSGGRADLGGTEHSVRTLATVKSAAELAALEITLADGRMLRLNQVATVTDTIAEPRSIALLDGEPVVGFEVMRALGASEIDAAEGVRAALATLRGQHPAINVVETFDFVAPVVENYEGSLHLFYEGAFLAVLVIFIFLRGWRPTLVAAVALPLSVIPTYAGMYLMGFSFNTITLLSLSLVIGILVDDAIVEVENIERHLLMGKSPFQAAMEAADEIGLAVAATSFALIAVFLPTAFMGGIVGRFFVQFGWTAAISVFFSLLLARMLTPMMAAYFLRAPKRMSEHDARWVSIYLQWARWCLRNRAVTVGAAAAFFVLGLWLTGSLPSGFMPSDDDTRTQVTLSLPPGSRLQDTLALAEQARGILQGHEHVKRIQTVVGSGGGDSGPSGAGSSSVRTATLTIEVAHRKDRPGVRKQDIESDFRDALTSTPGARINVGSGGSGESYVVVLAGDEGPLLEQHARQVVRELRTIPGVGAVTSTASLLRPELVVRTDFARAADLGVTSESIAEVLRVATTGDNDQDLAKLNLSERQVPVMVRLIDTARDDLETLKRLPVPGARGAVALENVAVLELGSGPAEITRYDRRRNINIEVELNGLDLGAVEKAALALPGLRRLPSGVARATTGDAEAMGELVSAFALSMMTGVLCIYLVLVLLLKDFVQPVTILAALVLSVPGAAFALFVTRSALSMPSLIGMIMLMGIVTKNSILLVDYIIIARRDHGLGRAEAVIDACRKRVRPIIMTTVAMGAGMLPIAMGWGTDPSFRAPMAVVVVGGLITSTFLSLLVIPVVYCYLDSGEQWVRRRLGRPLGAPAAGGPEHADA